MTLILSALAIIVLATAIQSLVTVTIITFMLRGDSNV